MAPLVIPLGHYLGTDGTDHRVRIGGRAPMLGPDAVAAWMLAHGEPELVTNGPWTTDTIRAALGPEADRTMRALAGLSAEGLVAEVEPDTTQALSFARAYRLRPLLTGLGAHPRLPDWYGLGRPGEPLVLVPEFAYDVWRTATATDNLWEASVVLAEAEYTLAEFERDERELTGDDPDDADAMDVDDSAEPRGVLADLLGTLHILLAGHAAYLDESWRR